MEPIFEPTKCLAASSHISPAPIIIAFASDKSENIFLASSTAA